jgi:hypothetical protein
MRSMRSKRRNCRSDLRHAAVDKQLGDEAGIARGEEERGSRDLPNNDSRKNDVNVALSV